MSGSRLRHDAALLFFCLTGVLLLIGCGKEGSKNAGERPAPRANSLEVSSGMQASPLDDTNVVRSFRARGIICEIPPGGQSVIVRHEEIPGFMPKMTMEFSVREPAELRGLKPGDAIAFQVRANEEDSWIEGLQRTNATDLAPLPPAGPTSSALLQAGQLKPGEKMEDAELLDETGRTFRLSEFRGRAVAFTFIFTRCPLPDFCPRMNQHFNRARAQLRQQSDGPTNWQFLSISFDAEFDQPGVLKRYASGYRGTNEDRWLFAVGPKGVIDAMGSKLDFRWANEGGSFVHNLRTVVLDTEGRVYRKFEGNRWKAEELAEALAEAAQGDASKTSG
jgi:protein SCO1/2